MCNDLSRTGRRIRLKLFLPSRHSSEVVVHLKVLEDVLYTA